MNFLETILTRKRAEVESRKKQTPVEGLKQRPFFGRNVTSLAAALSGKRIAIIAELKRASPSRNVIRQDFDPLVIAAEFVENGASALSVLTDEEFFQGSLDFLEQLRPAVSIPLLRKDFIIDEYQLYESKAAGADAVLLIATALARDALRELKVKCDELGMECLVEVHTAKDIAALAGLSARMIGVNNRDLTTFETDLTVSHRLRPLLPTGCIAVSESGIATAGDLRVLMARGYQAALIGESLMRARHPGKALSILLNATKGAPE